MDTRVRFFVSALLLCSLMSLTGGLWGQSGQSTQQAFVVNTGDESVSQVDLESMKEVRRFLVGRQPYGIAVSRDGKTVAVGVEGEEKVKFFDSLEFKLKGEVAIGKMHHDHIVLTPDGRYFLVANFYSDEVVGIDVDKVEEAFRIEGTSAPHVIKYGPSRKYAYVTCKKITGIAIVDANDRRLVKFHQINVNPRSLALSPDESKVYFGSFWVNGIFEMEAEMGKVTRLFELQPPGGNDGPQEVTYHGVEWVLPNVLLAANEGRSFVDAIDLTSGKLLDRETGVSKPCCIELIPGLREGSRQVLVSNIGDGTVQRMEVSTQGKLKTLGRARVGKSPKRVAFLP